MMSITDRVLELHRMGVPPSAIDKRLDLPSGSARRTIVLWWRYDKEGRDGWQQAQED